MAFTDEEEAAYRELYPNFSAYRDKYNGRTPERELPPSGLSDDA